MMVALLLLTSLILASAPFVPSAYAIALVATVSVGSGPLGVACDSGKSEVFVANEHSGTVSVISDATNSVVATVTVVLPPGEGPDTVAYDSGKGEVFVANSNDNTVSVISDATSTATTTVITTLATTVTVTAMLTASSTTTSLVTETNSVVPTWA